MQNCQTLISAKYIISQDKDRKIIKNGSIAINNGIITAIGDSENIKKNYIASQNLEFNNGIVLPGLINAHTHVAMTFLRGFADDLPLMQWLNTKIFPIEAKLTEKIVKIGSLLGFAEMLSTGTTACNDMYIFEKSVLESAKQCGIRCMAGEVLFKFPSAKCKTYKDALAITEELHEEYKNNDRLSIAVNPHSVYTTDEEIILSCRNLASKYNLPIHIHMSETSEETKICLQNFKKRPIHYCQDLGLFSLPCTMAHTIDLNKKDMESIKQYNLIPVHNPSSNMKLASGIAPIPEMLDMDIPVALGTDGPASNNQLNMFIEMGRCALLHKVNTKDPTTLPNQKVLDMATINGSRAIHNNKIGSLEEGKIADIIAVDLSAFNLQPIYDPISALIYASSGHEVVMSMVEGEVLYLNGNFTHIDKEALYKEVEDLKNFVLKSL